MVTKVTSGIKISVSAQFEGTILRQEHLHYAFSYTITIHNQSKITAQLISRFWEIKDALRPLQIVEGQGVIGKQPILQPDQKHDYSSGCLLVSSTGAMRGYYRMLNFSTGKVFEVSIPNFKLATAFVLN